MVTHVAEVRAAEQEEDKAEVVTGEQARVHPPAEEGEVAVPRTPGMVVVTADDSAHVSTIKQAKEDRGIIVETQTIIYML